MRPFPRNKKTHGLTLIEVLIALVIIAIAMTAIVTSSTETIRNVQYLENKTKAMWLANKIINEVRAGLKDLPAEEDTLHKETILGQNFLWQGELRKTPNVHVKAIDVQVFLPINKSIIMHMIGYQYVK